MDKICLVIPVLKEYKRLGSHLIILLIGGSLILGAIKLFAGQNVDAEEPKFDQHEGKQTLDSLKIWEKFNKDHLLCVIDLNLFSEKDLIVLNLIIHGKDSLAIETLYDYSPKEQHELLLKFYVELEKSGVFKKY